MILSDSSVYQALVDTVVAILSVGETAIAKSQLHISDNSGGVFFPCSHLIRPRAPMHRIWTRSIGVAEPFFSRSLFSIL